MARCTFFERFPSLLIIIEKEHFLDQKIHFSTVEKKECNLPALSPWRTALISGTLQAKISTQHFAFTHASFRDRPLWDLL